MVQKQFKTKQLKALKTENKYMFNCHKNNVTIQNKQITITCFVYYVFFINMTRTSS